MSRVTTFSRHFPAHHPRRGFHTYFVEQILNGLNIDFRTDWYWGELQRLNPDVNVTTLAKFYNSLYWDCRTKKHHTIRNGQSWKSGMVFSPRIWSGKPYNTTQIQFAPDMALKQVVPVCIEQYGKSGLLVIHSSDNGYNGKLLPLGDVATNDGLQNEDFINWFSTSKLKNLSIYELLPKVI